MRAALKRGAGKAHSRPQPTFLVQFAISDTGVASVAAADVLNSDEAKRQIAAVRDLRLAASSAGNVAKNR